MGIWAGYLMIHEAIRFVDKYGPELLRSKDGDFLIGRISERFPKIIVVEAIPGEEGLEYKGFNFLVSQDREKGTFAPLSPTNMREWLERNREILDKLEFDFYEKRLSPPGNKPIGSKSGLLSFSLFHFYIKEEKWFDPKSKKFIDNKIEKFKYSKDELAHILEHEDLRNEKDFIQKLNSEKGVRKLYLDLVGDLLNRFSLERSSLGREEKVRELNSLKEAVNNTHVYLRVREKEYLADILLEAFVSFKAFLKKDFPHEGKCQVCDNENVLVGPPASFNTFQDKKPFLQHRTREDPFSVSLCGKCSLKLVDFEKFLRDHNIDFFPLFVSDRELKEEIDYLKDRKERRIYFFEIIKRILDRLKEPELDFILLFLKRNILYYDYVSNYKFQLGRFHRYLGDREYDDLDLQNLYLEFRDKMKLISTRFFGSLEGEKEKLHTSEKKLIYRYREKIFNLLYRNENSLSMSDLSEIVYDIIDRRILNKDSTPPFKEEKEMLDLYLNSGMFVRNFNKFVMYNDNGSMLKKIRKEKKRIVEDNEDPEMESTEEFAYYLGQLIYYLIQQSEARNKMMLMIPIVNCRAASDLKRVVTEKFIDKYIHALSGYKDFRHKVISKTLDHLHTFQGDFSKIKVPFYVGFFDSNIFFEKKEKEKKKE